MSPVTPLVIPTLSPKGSSPPLSGSRTILVLDVSFLSLATRRSARSFTDRKSTRLNSSHVRISYAVFCLKKKTHFTQHCEYSWMLRVAAVNESRNTWVCQQLHGT